MKKLVIIGNAPVKKHFFSIKAKNYASFVNKADLVIRMNKCQNYRKGTGKKTDVLALINRGKPARRLSTSFEIKKEITKNCSEIWFTRPQNLPEKNPFELMPDESDKLLNYQILQNKKTEFISWDLYLELLQKINNSAEKTLFEPSSGWCIIEKILKEKRFETYEKYLLGFTWEGWQGHAWEIEKQICLKYIQEKKLKLLNIG